MTTSLPAAIPRQHMLMGLYLGHLCCSNDGIHRMKRLLHLLWAAGLLQRIQSCPCSQAYLAWGLSIATSGCWRGAGRV